MLFDTHCHLNFKAFDGKIDEVVKRAKEAGVSRFIVPGTDVETSKRAVELAEKYENAYAAVGIHPHHVYQYQISNIKYQKYKSNIKNDLKQIEELIKNPKVVAIGEVGLDKHYYQKTKYKDYQITDRFMDRQKTLFKEQIKLAVKYKKSLIIHSREAAGETLSIIGDSAFAEAMAGKVVFHCCEASDQLSEFVLAHRIYIGVDGDVTYSKSKQEFVKKIPLELLVLETDSPFLSPLRKFPNEPKNLPIIAEKIADIKKTSIKHLIKATEENSRKLFQIG